MHLSGRVLQAYKNDQGCESCPYYLSSGNLTFCEFNDPTSKFSKEWDKDSYCLPCPEFNSILYRRARDLETVPTLITYNTVSWEYICPDGGKHIFGKCVSNGILAGVAVGAVVFLLVACCC